MTARTRLQLVADPLLELCDKRIHFRPPKSVDDVAVFMKDERKMKKPSSGDTGHVVERHEIDKGPHAGISIAARRRHRCCQWVTGMSPMNHSCDYSIFH